MYLTHKDTSVTARSQAKELSPFGFQNWIWWGARQTNLAGSPCGASGARPGHCWQVSQHWPGVMLECGGRPSASILLHAIAVLEDAWHSNLAVKQQPILHGIGFLGPGNQTAGGIDLVQFQFYMIPWITKQNDCTENYLCFHMKIRLEPQNNSSSPIPQIKHGCNRYIHHQQVTSAQG